jgi:hypothetical protein
MTIPSTPTQMFVAEDWKKIYQSFTNAEFQSYDFDTLRRVMISYLQENYPEDFNDYVDSSEYIALVDLIAYLGQNLSFRIDLNARENFLETAQRRDSILKLAQLISYAPTRNVLVSGLLKITALSTTDSIIDSNGINLANTTIGWNDPTNPNWYEQFVNIMNSAMPNTYAVGTPYNRQTINGIVTDQYRISSTNSDVPVYTFLKNVNGISMNFEIVSSTIFNNTSIAEEAPLPANTFSFVYQNDNQGTAGKNTGFFAYFKQGQLGVSNFTVSNPVANEIIGVNVSNINNSDVWLWQLDANGNYSTLWTQVPAVSGNNVIYNSISSTNRNIYSVTSRDQDQIDLNFADGSFGNLPQGNFALFYRQSNALNYTIKPEQMSGIVVNIPYVNQVGQSQTMTLTLGLQYTVGNSATSETNESIKLKAPQIYYTQNRMVTAEDYNIAPLKLGSNILKVKSIARVTSGISKYFELTDVSGKYSSTNIFATDGSLYKKNLEQSFTFNFKNQNEVWSVIKNRLAPIVSNPALRSLYFDQYTRPDLLDLNLSWIQDSKGSNQSSGHFVSSENPSSVGLYISNNLRYIDQGAMIKFVAPASLPTTDPRYNPAKTYFKLNGTLTENSSDSTANYIWVMVNKVIGDGSNTGLGTLADGTGPVILSNTVDTAAVPYEVIPAFVNSFNYTFENDLVGLCTQQKNFGLRFDTLTRTWKVIEDTNLDLINPFSLLYQGDNRNSSSDASWLIAFVWQGNNYRVRYRVTNYIFESTRQTSFYIDPNSLNYDFTNNTLVKDQITVLSINPKNTQFGTGLGKDYQWQVDDNIVEVDGYVDPSKVKVSFYDYNNLGQISDPDAFNNIVATTSTNAVTHFLDKFVYFQLQADGVTYKSIDSDMFTACPTPNDAYALINQHDIIPTDGKLFYFYDPSYNVVNSYSAKLSDTTSPWVYEPNYVAFAGRKNLKFHYTHNSSEDRRIDPSKSNIIDIYLLTASYDANYRYWLSSGIGSEPLAPTSTSLAQAYSAYLEPIKTISDEIIFQPVKYKVLFGNQADVNLQATFKAVQSASSTLSTNTLQSRILTAINEFFSLQNWDFGQSFYFSELATYIMNLLTPDITNFVIVPASPNNFGSFYEITCLSNELFVSGASVGNIEIISAITASQLNTTNIITRS